MKILNLYSCHPDSRTFNWLFRPLAAFCPSYSAKALPRRTRLSKRQNLSPEFFRFPSDRVIAKKHHAIFFYHFLILLALTFPLSPAIAAKLPLTTPAGFCKKPQAVKKEKSFWQRGLSTITSAFSWKTISLGQFKECGENQGKITFSVFYNISGLTGSAENLGAITQKDYLKKFKIKAMRDALKQAIVTRSRLADRKIVTFPPKYMGSDDHSVFLMSSNKISSGKTPSLQLKYCAITPFEDKIIHFCWIKTAANYSSLKSALTLARLEQVNNLLEGYVDNFLQTKENLKVIAQQKR